MQRMRNRARSGTSRDSVVLAAWAIWYAQHRMLEAKKRALMAPTPDARERTENWVLAWGNLLRHFR